MQNLLPRFRALPWTLAASVFAVAVLSTALPRDASAGVLDVPIVGGSAAEPGDWPDVVAVFGEDGGLCSGVLLGADLVLTAGHCIGGRPVQVVVGSVDVTKPDGQWRDVNWAKAYPEWERTYDVGIVMLESPVLAKQRAVAENCTSGKRQRLRPGTRLEVAGFGLTTKTATDDNTRLHAATIEVVDGLCERDEACKQAVAPGGELTAGGHGIDACFGDSGGPVYIETSSGPALVALVSRGLATWAEPCGEGGVFVRTEPVLEWIEKESRRAIDRVECDLPRADADDLDGSDGTDGASSGDGALPGIGCHAAAGGALASGGVLGSGMAIVYGILCAGVLRRVRMRRRHATRRRAA